jgi:HAD superfamily hydrolase (TIGR01490 family)
MFRWLKSHNIFIREVSQSPMLYTCLRITIGTPEQMKYVLKIMGDFYKQRPIKKIDKIALFDFCDTMVDFQTGNAFSKYVIAHGKIKTVRRLVYKVKHIWYKHILGKDLEKPLLLQCCRGISREKMEQMALNYYYEIVRPHLIKATMDKLLEYQQKGYKIYIVSGGFDLYIKYFAQEFNVDGVFSTQVGFENNVCTGKYDGVDCMGDNKIKILQDYFHTTTIDGVAFSDSITDMPLLKFVKTGFAVGTNLDYLKWAKDNNLKTLIYTPKEYYKD